MLDALKNNFEGYEILRAMCVNKVPKYGNDIDEVDKQGTKWADYFKNRLRTFKTIEKVHIIQECIPYQPMCQWVKM